MQQKVTSLPTGATDAIRNVCVYCGSGLGSKPVFAEAAGALGRLLAERGVGLVYGGGGRGLMGTIARSTIGHGGRVTGVIPEFLVGPEHAFREATELIVTATMHERKRLMFEKSDAFVALPGGVGTLEELIEQVTWAQIGQHSKPLVLANVAGYWNPLFALLDHMTAHRFIRPGLEVRYFVAEEIGHVLPAIYRAVAEREPEPSPSGQIEPERL